MNLKMIETTGNLIKAEQTYWVGLNKYIDDFMIPYETAAKYITRVERDKLFCVPVSESMESYLDLFTFYLDIVNKELAGRIEAINNYHLPELNRLMIAWFTTLFNLEGEDISAFMERYARTLELVTYRYHESIKEIESEYGFHFERSGYIKTAETERFDLYQVLPNDPRVKVREDGKPILIIPPYVLGSNVLAFLPGENKSYVHSFANQGIPTYIRILKDIKTNPAVQVMTGEDDTLDTRFFCEQIKEKHGKLLTLNGYCQGGFTAVCNLLTGKLDGLVDALITCVSPIDGTRSKGLGQFLKDLPRRFNDLAYGTKTLPNGNQVADGDLMSWVYKIKSIDDEAPIVAFYRDLMMMKKTSCGDKGDGQTAGRRRGEQSLNVSKTALAINYWLTYERNDLPMAITEMSFKSYNIPITKDGTLPVKLFNRKLNFARLKEKGIKWLICYGEDDDLVEKETALSPLDYVDTEVTMFPKGHVAIATSWSRPTSEYALHKRFANNQRGPVRYHLDLEREHGHIVEASEGLENTLKM
ncbi:MAG: metal transporter [Deltaproteobacteria bacterium]|nr:metal transporter [Deltaproteobacteria bacterium]